jgi:alpha-amylase/alpha-mannosidase (GH57 family)
LSREASKLWEASLAEERLFYFWWALETTVAIRIGLGRKATLEPGTGALP